MSYAPVILFVYNRPQYTRLTLQALAQNRGADQTELYVFADGPKAGAGATELAAIEEVRALVQAAPGFKRVQVEASPHNKGLAKSVLSGVGKMLESFEAVIVIEDDVVTSPYLLAFMNEALTRYADDERVMSIGSWNYYYQDPLLPAFFSPLPDTICWATWRRSWQSFQQDEQVLYDELRQQHKLYDFNLQNRFPYEAMLKQQIAGQVNSWAIRWTAHACLQEKLCLYPGVSLSKHIGFGADSTHVKSADYNADLVLADRPVPVGPLPVVANPASVEAFLHFEQQIRPIKTSRKKRLKATAKRLVKPVRSRLQSALGTKPYGWFGHYKTWEEAAQQTGGYDENSILETVRKAVLKVKQGEARYERDGVILDSPFYTTSLISTLYEAATRYPSLHVIDFGGSLGSSFFQLKPYLQKLPPVQWSVVEQNHFVELGRREFAEPGLDFFPTIEAAVAAKGVPTLLLLACTLPYLSDPYHWLKAFASVGAPYLLLENMPFHDQPGDRLTVQRVPPEIYQASYPCWLLDQNKVIASLSNRYQLKFSLETGVHIPVDHREIPYESLLFVPQS